MKNILGNPSAIYGFDENGNAIWRFVDTDPVIKNRVDEVLNGIKGNTVVEQAARNYISALFSETMGWYPLPKKNGKAREMIIRTLKETGINNEIKGGINEFTVGITDNGVKYLEGFSHDWEAVYGIDKIVKLAEECGGKAYVVGGAVRDKILGLTPNDYDIVIVGAHEDAMRYFHDELPGSKYGNCYPLIRYYGDEKYEITFSASGTIEQDLFRRDTTMNAMAIDILSGELIDPYGGQADLAEHIVRHVNKETFNPLCAFRVARQVCSLETKTGVFWDVPGDTLQVMHDCKPETAPSYRINYEYRDAERIGKTERFEEVLAEAGISITEQYNDAEYRHYWEVSVEE